MITNIESLKSHINIIDVIGYYLPLRKSGGNYSACCPFHDERTPSFMVSESKQIFNCFSCNKGGDAITFVKEYKKLEFIEAIEEIARILNFTLEYKQGRKDYVLENNKIFLEHCLKGRDVIKNIVLERGFDTNIINEFSLGYGGEGFEIKKLFESSDKNLESAFKTGLLYENNNGINSVFKKRLIIPVFDSNGVCVGFSGRAIDKKQHPKYINSKESYHYKKRHILYGYNLAKKHIIEKKEAIIVEGYFDVISLHFLGYRNAVGICGTAFCSEHIALLQKRGEVSIILALDNDEAGINATKRAIDLLLENEIYKSYVLKIDSKQKDFNDILLNDKLCLESMKKVPVIKFLLKDIHARLYANNMDSIETRADIAKEIKSVLEKIKNEYIRMEYHKYAIKLFGFDVGKLDSKMQKAKKRTQKGYDITLARILKGAFNNKEYLDALIACSKREYFGNLESSYENCINGVLDSTLSEIIFNNEYVLDYKDINEFLMDLSSLQEFYKEKEKQEFVRDSSISLADKISYMESFECF